MIQYSQPFFGKERFGIPRKDYQDPTLSKLVFYLHLVKEEFTKDLSTQVCYIVLSSTDPDTVFEKISKLSFSCISDMQFSLINNILKQFADISCFYVALFLLHLQLLEQQSMQIIPIFYHNDEYQQLISKYDISFSVQQMNLTNNQTNLEILEQNISTILLQERQRFNPQSQIIQQQDQNQSQLQDFNFDPFFPLQSQNSNFNSDTNQINQNLDNQFNQQPQDLTISPTYNPTITTEFNWQDEQQSINQQKENIIPLLPFTYQLSSSPIMAYPIQPDIKFKGDLLPTPQLNSIYIEGFTPITSIKTLDDLTNAFQINSPFNDYIFGFYLGTNYYDGAIAFQTILNIDKYPWSYGMSPTDAFLQFKQAFNSKGKLVRLSLFGGTIQQIPDSSSFISGLKQFLQKYPFDGFDIDLETYDPSSIHLIPQFCFTLCQSFRTSTYTSQGVITMAPQGTSLFAQDQSLLDQLSKLIDYYYIQFYNYGQWYDQQGIDFHLTQQVGSASYIKSLLPKDKIVIGLPLFTQSGTSNQTLTFLSKMYQILEQDSFKIFFWQMYQQGDDTELSKYCYSLQQIPPRPLISKAVKSLSAPVIPPSKPISLPPAMIQYAQSCKLRFQTAELYSSTIQLSSIITTSNFLPCQLIINNYIKFLCFYYKLQNDVSSKKQSYLISKYYNFQSIVSIYGQLDSEFSTRIQEKILIISTILKLQSPSIEILTKIFEFKEISNLSHEQFPILAQAIIFLSQVPNECRKFLQLSPTCHMANQYGQLNYQDFYSDQNQGLNLLTADDILKFKTCFLQLAQTKYIHPNFSFFSMFSKYFIEIINQERTSKAEIHQLFTQRVLDKLQQRTFQLNMNIQLNEQQGIFYSFDNITQRPVDDITESYYFYLEINEIQPKIFQVILEYQPPSREQDTEDKLTYQTNFPKFYEEVLNYLRNYKPSI